jgi:hypothetical protein
MARAAIMIGINRTGGLPVLSDAVEGARQMEAWALAQGMARKHVHLFTDESGPVEIATIKKAIRALVDSGTITQLLVYFAGHGVNIRYGEYWLLSDAPVDPSAAVNVEGSVVLARRSGIDHVVFVSDACRTAAEGVQAQGITGSEIFPNDPVDGPERAVDLFFATTLGRPALEVKSPDESSAAFHAVYTTALLDAVGGKLPPAVQEAPGKTPSFVVRPRSLKDCLRVELPRRLAALRVAMTVSQEPDARITSDDAAWIAGFDAAPAVAPVPPPSMARAVPRGGPTRSGVRTAVVLHPSAGAAARAAASRQLDDALGGARAGGAGPATRGPRMSPMPDGPSATLAKPFGPLRFEINCGFKLRGAKLADVVGSGVGVERFDDDTSLARVHPQGGAGNVLLVLADQSSVLLPAVPGFVAALSFEAGELADVAYEPSQYSNRWADFAQGAHELRQLRAAIAHAAREGVFRLEGPAALALARRMQLAKGLDPSLALYAAYAYHGLQQTERLQEMREYFRSDMALSFFDLDLLAGALPRGGEAERRYPPVPMLAQGWSLLSAFGVSLSEHLRELRASPGAPRRPLQGELVNTLWTQFKPAGTEHLRKLIEEGKLL